MSKLTKLSTGQLTGEARALFERIGAERGKVPNMYQVYAHRPEILTTFYAHLEAITNAGTVPVRTKELVATLVSRINHCDY
jgi:alkylhydroperoxidase family enzyme